MKKFFQSLLSEEGNISSKRFISLVGFFFLLMTMLINSFTDINKAPASSLVNSVELITLVCIGGSVADKFRDRKINNHLREKNNQ
jgi:hypothetical protein